MRLPSKLEKTLFLETLACDSYQISTHFMFLFACISQALPRRLLQVHLNCATIYLRCSKDAWTRFMSQAAQHWGTAALFLYRNSPRLWSSLDLPGLAIAASVLCSALWPCLQLPMCFFLPLWMARVTFKLDLPKMDFPILQSYRCHYTPQITPGPVSCQRGSRVSYLKFWLMHIPSNWEFQAEAAATRGSPNTEMLHMSKKSRKPNSSGRDEGEQLKQWRWEVMRVRCVGAHTQGEIIPLCFEWNKVTRSGLPF